MNRIAANPLMITTGRVLANGVEHRWRLFGQDRGEETEVSRHCDQIGAGESGQEAGQSQPAHRTGLRRDSPGRPSSTSNQASV